MRGWSHIAVGASGLVMVESLAYRAGLDLTDSIPLAGIELPQGILLIGAASLGAVFPDIDHPDAMISRFSYKGVRLFQWLSKIVRWAFGHRGGIHSLAALVLFTELAFLWLSDMNGGRPLLFLTLAFGLGYLSHLVADAMTVSGVKFFLPFNTNSYRFPPGSPGFTTGSPQELIVAGAFVLVAAALALLTGAWAPMLFGELRVG